MIDYKFFFSVEREKEILVVKNLWKDKYLDVFFDVEEILEEVFEFESKILYDFLVVVK